VRQKRIRTSAALAAHWERAIRIVSKNYLARMTARAIHLVELEKRNAPHLLEATEAIDFPQRDQVLRRWSRVKNTLNVKNPSVWTPRIIPDFSYYRERIVDREDERWFVDLLFGLKKEAYQSALGAAAAALGRQPWPSVETLDAIRAKTVKIVTTTITPHLRDELLAKIESSINAGFTIDETAHDLGFLNTNWRTIARTETFDVMNAGSRNQVMNEAAEFGADIVKFWQHSGNTHNPRISHLAAADQYNQDSAIPVDEPFIVNGIPMQMPHDPDAPAEEVVNCGCTAVYLVKQPDGSVSE